MNNSTTTIGPQQQFELQDGIIAESKKYIKELAEFEDVKNRCLAGEFSIKDFEKELYKNKYGNKRN